MAKAPSPPIPRQVFAPDRFAEALTRFSRHVSMTFDFRDPEGKVDRYTGVLATNNDEVNLQDEWCFVANLLYLGHRPPVEEFMIVIPKPSGWKKLRVYWVQSKRELKLFLHRFRTGQGVSHAFAFKYRTKFAPEVPSGGWGEVL